jgi:hypothetical protein
MRKAKKILDATSGTGEYHMNSTDTESFEFTINGTPNANIKIFVLDKKDTTKSYLLIKTYCADWGTGTVVPSCKLSSDEDDDIFSETGTEDIISENGLYVLNY